MNNLIARLFPSSAANKDEDDEDDMSDAASPTADNAALSDAALSEDRESPSPAPPPADPSNASESAAISLSRNNDTNITPTSVAARNPDTQQESSSVEWRALFTVDTIRNLLLLADDEASKLVGKPVGEVRQFLRTFYGNSVSIDFIKETSEVFSKCQDCDWISEMRAHNDHRPTDRTFIPRQGGDDDRKPAARKTPPEHQGNTAVDNNTVVSYGMMQDMMHEMIRNYQPTLEGNPQGNSPAPHINLDVSDNRDSHNPDSQYALIPLGFVQVGLNASTITPTSTGVNHWTHALNTEDTRDIKVAANWGVHYWDRDRINVTHGTGSAGELTKKIEYLTNGNASRMRSSLTQQHHVTGFVPYTSSDAPTGMINPGRFASQVLVGVKYPPSALLTQTNRSQGFSRCTSHSICGRSVLQQGLRVMISGENTFSINSKNTIYAISVFEQKPGGFPGCRVGFVKCARNVIHVYHGRAGFIQYIAHNDHSNLDVRENKFFTKVKGYAHIILDDSKTMAQLMHPNNQQAWEDLIEQTMVIPSSTAGLPTESRVQENFSRADRTKNSAGKKRTREG